VKFTITQNLQGKSMPGMPCEIEVGPAEPKQDDRYKCPADCTIVYPVSVNSMMELIERGLVLKGQAEQRVVVCGCQGSIAGEKSFPDILESHLSTWGPSCGAPLSVYRGHLEKLLEAHGRHVRTDGGWREHPSQHAIDCSIQLDGKSCDCGLPMLRLKRPLAVLDLETTDAEPTTCAIFQFGVTILMPDGSRKCWDKTFKPWTPITPGAEEVTGTTNAMVEKCPPFKDYVAQILKGLDGKDLAGFNLKSFDLVCLDEEARRCGLKLNLDGVTVIDAFHLFQRKDPRDLTAAVKKFCGREHKDAHGALADSQATADVIEGLIATYPDLAEMSLAELDKFSMRDPERQLADLAGKFYRDSDGDLRYTLAKARDVKVRDDPGFGMWMLRQNSPPFAGSTRDVLKAEMERLGL
jgi:DNA polymerase-3 subunit epsilon